jgi:hypothetical protein
MPALNLGSFIALEQLRKPDISELTAQQAGEYFHAKSQRATQWGERNLYRNLAQYASEPEYAELTGSQRDEQIITSIVEEVHSRLSHWTQLHEKTGQSQGIEVEVLKQLKAEDWYDWVKRYKLEQFFPRGIALDQMARKDWMVLGIVGVNEDLGERPNEIHEMSTNPTQTVTGQTTILYELMLGGFIDERHLQNDKEMYSMHASTLFPEEIFIGNTSAHKEYVRYALAFGGAYSSLARMKNGAWVTYQDGKDYEIKWDRMQTQQKLKPVPGLATSGHNLIVEIRTLDLAERYPFSALQEKEMLDFGFKSYWLQQLGESPSSSRDLLAAQVWQDFSKNMDGLYREYGITTHWQDIGNTREVHPEFQTKLQKLLRSNAHKIQKLVEQPDSAFESFQTTNETPIVSQSIELFRGKELSTSTVSFPQNLIEGFGLQEGSVYTVRAGQSVRTVTVESSLQNTIACANDVMEYLNLPSDCSPRIRYDQSRRELNLGPVIGIAITPTKPTSEFIMDGDPIVWAVVDAQVSAAKKAGAIVYVFDPDKFDSTKETMPAYVATKTFNGKQLSEEDQLPYSATRMPRPDIIFNWSYRDLENPKYAELLSTARVANEKSTIPITVDKQRFNDVMAQVDSLKKRLPETMVITKAADILEVAKKHEFVVVKPKNGEEGKNIYFFKHERDGSLSYSHPGWQRPEGGIERDEVWVEPNYVRINSIEDFYSIVGIDQSSDEYLVQQGIHVAKVPYDSVPGAGFDNMNVEIRTVLQRDRHGNISLVGKQEKRKDWIERLTPKFGAEGSRKIVDNTQALAYLAGLVIDKELGGNAVSILAVDIFVDDGGNLWLGEANSAPTLLYFNSERHPDLLLQMAHEQLLDYSVQTGFIPKSALG